MDLALDQLTILAGLPLVLVFLDVIWMTRLQRDLKSGRRVHLKLRELSLPKKLYGVGLVGYLGFVLYSELTTIIPSHDRYGTPVSNRAPRCSSDNLARDRRPPWIRTPFLTEEPSPKIASPVISFACLSNSRTLDQFQECRVSGATGANDYTPAPREWNRNSPSSYKKIGCSTRHMSRYQ